VVPDYGSDEVRKSLALFGP